MTRRNPLRSRLLGLGLGLVLGLAASCGAPAPTPTPQPTPSVIPRALIEEAAAFCPQPRNWTLYVTQPGDTLRSLAERTSSSAAELALANCLQNPGALPAGIVFYLPRQPITPS